MDDFVTVLTTPYPQQLWIVKGRLEAEGIQCFVKDELTVQSYNLLSNAVGGVKLQVRSSDVEQANTLLFELGYKKEEPIQVDLLTWLNKKTKSIPLVNSLSIVARIVLLVILAVAFLTIVVYYLIRPSAFELLSRQAWCVDKIYYKGQLVGPNTLNAFVFENLNGEKFCSENASFDNNGRLTLPGLNSTLVYGNWKENYDGTIQLSADTFKAVFNGSFQIDASENQFVLKSVNTAIYAHIDKTYMPTPLDGIIK